MAVTLNGTAKKLAPVDSLPNTDDAAERDVLAAAVKVLADHLGGKVTVGASAYAAMGDETDTLTVTVSRA